MYSIQQEHTWCNQMIQLSNKYMLCFFLYGKLIFKDFIYFQKEGKRRRKNGRETSMCGCLLCAPYWGPGPQPRHVPSLGIEPATLCHRPVLNPLSHTSQGRQLIFKSKKVFFCKNKKMLFKCLNQIIYNNPQSHKRTGIQFLC